MVKKIIFLLIFSLLCSISFAYNINAGDELDLVSVSMPEISGKYIVGPDGDLTVPYGGTLNVMGKSVVEVTKEISKLLSKRISKPEVYINVSKSYNNAVFVTGWVAKPGTYNIDQNSKLASIIALAGDIKLQDGTVADDNIVFIIKSSDGSKKEILYKDMIDSDYVPKSGDIINAELKGKISVNVVGEVSSPGRYVLSDKNDTVMGAVIMAGGFTAAADYSKISIYTMSGKNKVANLSKYISNENGECNEKLEDNVTVIVPELINGITVLGWVKTQGRQIYKPNETVRLSDAIAQAGGGVQNKARYNQVYVLREENGEYIKTAFNFNDFQKKGDMAGNPVLKSGDVVFMPCSLQIDWSVILSSLRNVAGFGRDVKEL